MNFRNINRNKKSRGKRSRLFIVKYACEDLKNPKILKAIKLVVKLYIFCIESSYYMYKSRL